MKVLILIMIYRDIINSKWSFLYWNNSDGINHNQKIFLDIYFNFKKKTILWKEFLWNWTMRWIYFDYSIFATFTSKVKNDKFRNLNDSKKFKKQIDREWDLILVCFSKSFHSRYLQNSRELHWCLVKIRLSM